MKSIFLYIYLLVCPVILYSQTNIKGKITDGQTQQAIPGISISNLSKTVGTTSNDKGEFVLQSDSTIRELLIIGLGYKTIRLKVKGDEKNLHVEMESEILEMDAVTIVGFESNRKLLETPASVSYVRAEDIQKFNNVSLAPALNNVPGVNMTENGMGGSSRLSIRGSMLRSPWGIRNIKIYWNDIPLTDPSGNSARFNAIDVNSIGSIEILKGPSGSIYGAGTGGVISITSARAKAGEKSFELSNMVGSYGLRRSLATLRVGSESSNFFVSYLDQNLDNYRDQQKVDKKVFNLMATFYPGDKRKISLNAFHYDGKFELPGSLTKAEYDANPRQAQSFAAKSDNRVSNKSTAFAVSQHYDISSKLQNVTSASVIFNAMDHPWGSGSFYNGYTISTSQGIAVRSRMVYSPKIGKIQSRFVVGGEYQTAFELEKEYQNVLGNPGDLQGDYELKSTQSILFAQTEFDLPAQFLLTFGASFNNTKYDYINRLIPDSLNPRLKISFDPAISPRVALLKKFNDNKSVFASVSYGFSPPTQYEVQTQAGINPGLKPEHGWNYEVGTRGNILNSKFNYDVVAYYFHLQNAILPRINAADQEYFENSGSTNQYGVEAALSYVIFSNSEKTISLLKPWVSYTFNHYRFRNYRKESFNWATSSVTVLDYSGRRVTGIAPNIIAAGIDAESKYGFYLNLTYNFFDEIPLTDDNSVSVDAYSVVHSRLGYRKTFLKHFAADIFYGLNNITDTKYNNVLSLNASGGRYYNPAAGRNYFTGLSLKYIL